jgi:hypothetical protein
MQVGLLQYLSTQVPSQFPHPSFQFQGALQTNPFYHKNRIQKTGIIGAALNMMGDNMESNPDALLAQLRALIANPGVFSNGPQRQEITKLSRQAAVMLEDPFETFQRLAYSVCSLQIALPNISNPT